MPADVRVTGAHARLSGGAEMSAAQGRQAAPRGAPAPVPYAGDWCYRLRAERARIIGPLHLRCGLPGVAARSGVGAGAHR